MKFSFAVHFEVNDLPTACEALRAIRQLPFTRLLSVSVGSYMEKPPKSETETPARG